MNGGIVALEEMSVNVCCGLALRHIKCYRMNSKSDSLIDSQVEELPAENPPEKYCLGIISPLAASKSSRI